MKPQRPVLGRGLSALIPTPSEGRFQKRGGLMTCSVDEIDPSPFQARRSFDEEKIDRLAESVRVRGLLQPLIVRKVENRYQLIAGERRWRAAKKAGLNEVPIVVKDWGDGDVMAIGLVENLQREDLNPIDEALGYQALIEEHGWTHQRLSQEVGKDRTTVTNTLRLIHLPLPIQQALMEGVLTEGHARALLGLPNEKAMLQLADRIVREGLSVRQVEAIVREGSERAPKKRSGRASKDIYLRQLEEDWTRALGTKVCIHPKKKGGVIEISYYSDSDLNRLQAQFFGRHKKEEKNDVRSEQEERRGDTQPTADSAQDPSPQRFDERDPWKGE